MNFKENADVLENPRLIDKSNENFWKWFGNSKAVDENGNPLVVYHGTDKDFTAFNRKFAKNGFFFVTEKRKAEVAGYYAYSNNRKGKIMPCYLSIKNPYICNPSDRDKVDLSKYDGIIVVSNYNHESPFYDYEKKKLNTSKLNKGDIIEIIVFSPNQIKSVDNNGDWSSSDNIYETLNEQLAYHGTRAEFDKFDLNKFQRGDYGYGVYFTYDKLYAGDYGNVKQYEIPDEEYLLDWDFSTQSEYIQEKLYSIWQETKSKDKDKLIEKSIYGNVNTGYWIYMAISQVLNLSSKNTSEYLYKHGIKGISSYRGNCIVIFNPEDTKMIETSLTEKFEEIADGVYATNSIYDVVHRIKNKPASYRIIYDYTSKYFFIGDSYNYTHDMLLKLAYKQGFYPQLIEQPGKGLYDNSCNYLYSSFREYLIEVTNAYKICVFEFEPNPDKRKDIERAKDGYDQKYSYDFGCIYGLGYFTGPEFKECPLYQYLGKPIKQEELSTKINERFEEIERNVWATNSGYDIINRMKNKKAPYRIIWDNNIRYYFIGDAFDYIHLDMLEYAYEQAFYPNMLSANECNDYMDQCMEDQSMILFAFDPDGGSLIDMEKSSDGYTRKYVYDFGTIYAHEFTPLEKCPIYELLGEPIKKENVYEDFKYINECLERFLNLN